MIRQAKLGISKPEDGAVFCLVPGSLNQKIVCQAVGNDEKGRLWWFVDDVYVGESMGRSEFLVDMRLGEHVLVCSTEEGQTARVRVRVEAQ